MARKIIGKTSTMAGGRIAGNVRLGDGTLVSMGYADIGYVLSTAPEEIVILAQRAIHGRNLSDQDAGKLRVYIQDYALGITRRRQG